MTGVRLRWYGVVSEKMCTIVSRLEEKGRNTHTKMDGKCKERHIVEEVERGRHKDGTSGDPVWEMFNKRRSGYKYKYWDWFFYAAPPTVWNMLPSNVRSVEHIAKVRDHIKAYLYNLTYPP